MTSLCSCGGETQVEHYDRPHAPVEWFRRCLTCGAMSEPVDTPEQAAQLTVTGKEAVCDRPQ